MNLKSITFVVFTLVLGILLSSFFVGNVLMSQVLTPFGSLSNVSNTPQDVSSVSVSQGQSSVQFLDADFLSGWIPWVIKQVSILIGGLSLVIFFYAGISLVINGDNEEEFSKSTKMVLFGVIGIALAALSYSIVANVLVIF